jgi:hypothetical protein
MFQVYCPVHRCRVLLSTSRITALHNDADGVVVGWTCWCGHRGRSLDGQTLGPAHPAATAAVITGEESATGPVDGDAGGTPSLPAAS